MSSSPIVFECRETLLLHYEDDHSDVIFNSNLCPFCASVSMRRIAWITGVTDEPTNEIAKTTTHDEMFVATKTHRPTSE